MGSIDDVRFYDTVLSGAQIQGLCAVPEPSAFLLLGVGLIGLIVRKRFSSVS